MILHEAVRVELAPSGRKLALLREHVVLARFVWNWALGLHEENGWPIGGKRGLAARVAAVEAKQNGAEVKLAKRLSAPELSRRWTSTVDEHAPWARFLCRSTVTYAIRAVDDAYKHAFRRIKAGQKAGFPRFRGRHHPHRGFTLQDQAFRCTRWAVKLGKMGMIPVRNARRNDTLDRLQGARVLRLVVEERAGRWFLAIMVEREVTEPNVVATPVVGMDLGWAITLSDGRTYDPPMALHRYLLWIRHWSRAMSRRKPKPGQHTSHRYRKAKRTLATLYLRAESIRRDWIHQVSHDVTTRYGTIVTEGFDVARFVEHGVAGTYNRRVTLDIGWGSLRLALAYKAARRGKIFLQLGKHDLTDQTCSRCGATDPRTDGQFRCPSVACGHTDSRPRNTADLMERIGRGEPPNNDIGRGDLPRSPAGKAGVNARGDRKAHHGGPGRRSESGNEEPAGRHGVTDASLIMEFHPHDRFHPEKARKSRNPPGRGPRVKSQREKWQKDEIQPERTGPLNGVPSS